ncbi:MAG: hypothetical protein WDM71_10585 [Ferruginibacter sp.]
MIAINPFDFFVEEYAEKFPFKYRGELPKELIPYLEVSESGPLLQQWVDRIDKSEKPINDFFGLFKSNFI